MTDKKKAAPGRTGTASSNASTSLHSTTPQRHTKDPLIGWFNLASPMLKRQQRQKRGRK